MSLLVERLAKKEPFPCTTPRVRDDAPHAGRSFRRRSLSFGRDKRVQGSYTPSHRLPHSTARPPKKKNILPPRGIRCAFVQDVNRARVSTMMGGACVIVHRPPPPSGQYGYERRSSMWTHDPPPWDDTSQRSPLSEFDSEGDRTRLATSVSTDTRS